MQNDPAYLGRRSWLTLAGLAMPFGSLASVVMAHRGTQPRS
jgi:hypothetical protein